jgi:hypothetical protein
MINHRLAHNFLDALASVTMGRLLKRRAECRAISMRRHTTAHFTVVITVLCTGYEEKQNCLMCAYEYDFGDNDIISIVTRCDEVASGLRKPMVTSAFRPS